MCTLGLALRWEEQGKVDNPQEVKNVGVVQLHSVLLQQTSTLQPQLAQDVELEEREGRDRREERDRSSTTTSTSACWSGYSGTCLRWSPS